jgi:hypothetical protein
MGSWLNKAHYYAQHVKVGLLRPAFALHPAAHHWLSTHTLAPTPFLLHGSAATPGQMLDEFLQQRKVPVSLRTRIREFFVFTGRRQLSPDDAALVEGALIAHSLC